MRIAQVAPLYESVPPKFYGGTERVISYLTEELVRLGHEVTLFASCDSRTSARLQSGLPVALRLNHCVDPIAPHLVMFEKLFSMIEDYDLVHFHTDYWHYPIARRYAFNHVTTLHGRLDIPELPALYQEFSEVPLVSISDAQRRPLPWANWQATVYHGLPLDLYAFEPRRGDYLAFLGRLSPEKRIDRAVEIARRFGMKLRVAAKIDTHDDAYLRTVRDLLKDPCLEFIGEVAGREKEDLLAHAYALLFPIDWPEPFGLVMIESLACGTPVVAFRNGSVPEIIDNARTGFIVDTIDQALDALTMIPSLERHDCRQDFESRFSASRMTKDYLRVYERLLGANSVGSWAGQAHLPHRRTTRSTRVRSRPIAVAVKEARPASS